jgi:hypothetical protein
MTEEKENCVVVHAEWGGEEEDASQTATELPKKVGDIKRAFFTPPFQYPRS